ncbi:MAG: 30S ribosome-binding factor RbfA [Thermodesulfobacteriota bacterium]
MRKAHSIRAHRLEEQVLHELGRILVKEIQDPRLELLTFSGVRLNADLTIAEVLYTHRGDQKKEDEVQKGLKAAAGFLRFRLGKKLDLRHVPELRFKWDEFLEEMIHDQPENKDC